MQTMTKKKLEQRWVKYQLDIAGLRSALGAMCNIAFNARREHTFFPEDAPRGKGVQAVMGATAGEPNGIPDAWSIACGDTYTPRSMSIMAASIIILSLHAAVRQLATELGQPSSASMQAGEDMPGPANPPVKASKFLWAAANSVRHVDEWHVSGHAFNEPRNAAEKSLLDKQKASIEPLAAVFGHAAPITENVAFEALQCLVAASESAGNYLQLELHLLRIGQDLIQRSGLSPAPIGVTVTAYHDLADLEKIPADDVVMSDGTMRAAASLPDVTWINPIGPRLRQE